MNDYEVTYANGEVVVIAAWTPEAAIAIAEEDGDLYGCAGISAVTVSLSAAPGGSLKPRLAGPIHVGWVEHGKSGPFSRAVEAE